MRREFLYWIHGECTFSNRRNCYYPGRRIDSRRPQRLLVWATSNPVRVFRCVAAGVGRAIPAALSFTIASLTLLPVRSSEWRSLARFEPPFQDTLPLRGGVESTVECLGV